MQIKEKQNPPASTVAIEVSDPTDTKKKKNLNMKEFAYNPKKKQLVGAVPKLTYNPQATSVHMNWVPPPQVYVPVAPVLAAIPKTPQVDVEQVIKNVVAEQAKQEEARKAA